MELSREKESKASMAADFKAAEHTQEKELKTLKKELSAATGEHSLSFSFSLSYFPPLSLSLSLSLSLLPPAQHCSPHDINIHPRTRNAETLRASLDTQSNSKGKGSTVTDLREQLEQKVKQLEALNKKFDDAQAESEMRESNRSSEKSISDQRTRQLSEEIEQLTTTVESGLSKCRRAEQQLLFSQEDAADKELRYHQSRQASAALQKRCDEAESEVLVWRGKCKSDAVQSDVTVEELTAQLASMKAAKAVVESLLLSSGDDDDLERSELLAKISKLNIELAAERSAVADRDSLANSLKLEQAELQKRTQLLEEAQSRIGALEAELRETDSQLIASQAELAAVNNRIQNSDSTAKRAAADQQQQIAFLTASNASLSDRVEHKLAEVQSLTESMVQLQELLAVTEKNLEDSAQMSNDLREHLEREKSKTRLLQQVEDERDHHRKSFSSSEEHARGLEAIVTKLRADLSTAQATIASQSAAVNASDTSGLLEQLTETALKIKNLSQKNAELESNMKYVSERERTQSVALLSLQAAHKKSLQEIESMNVRNRVTNSQEVEEKEKELNNLQQVISIERNQHQKVLSSLHEVLKSKEIEISTLKGDKVALVRLAEKTSLAPHTAAVDEGGIGIAALSAIVGQQQTSVQRLQEKLESTEGLILALTQALPSQAQTQQSKPQATPHVPQDSPKRVKKAAVAVSARSRRGGSADNDSEGESERKATSSADYHRYDKMTPSSMGNDSGRRGNDRELEKDLLLSPEWQSPSDSDIQRYPAHHRSSSKADMETRNSWSKIPTRHDTIGPSRSPTRSRPRQKEKDRERERETPQTDIGLEIWALKIARENRFLDDLMATLKDEKLSVRKEQDVLGKRRAAWRMKKASNHKDTAGKAELRAESSELNAQTTRLNGAVEQTRVMHGFLTERRRKLDALKEYLQQLSVSNESSQRTRSKGAPVLYREDDAELTLEVMERLGRELDSEAEVTLHEYGYSSSADEYYASSSAYSQVGQQDQQRGVRKSHNHDPSPAMHDRLYQQNLQTIAQNQNQTNVNQNHGQNVNQMHSQNTQQYQQHPSIYLQAPMKGFYPPNQVRGPFDPRGELLGYEHQYSQGGYSQPSSAYMQQRQGQGQGSGSGSGQSQHDDFYPTSSSPPRMVVDDPARWAQPASSVRFNLGIKGISGDTSASFPYTDRGVHVGVKDPRAIRDQLKDLTNRRAQTTEAFDTHARYVQPFVVVTLTVQCTTYK
jgi:hypothetical protein